MRRLLITTVLLVLIVCVQDSRAQDPVGAVSLDFVSGEVAPGVLGIGLIEMRVKITMESDAPFVVIHSNGFVLHSPDGATLSAIEGITLPVWEDLFGQMYTQHNLVQPITGNYDDLTPPVDMTLGDSITFSVAGLNIPNPPPPTPPGLPPGYDEVSWTIQFETSLDDQGKHIGFDSCGYRYQWESADASYELVEMSWLGPYNFTISACLGDPDQDDDGVGDPCDLCTDSDGDGLGDPGFAANLCPNDNCPYDDNPGQEDFDGDGLGDACDPDDDDDGIPDIIDNCLFLANPDRLNSDTDDLGDACDPDDDDDTVLDENDNCPTVANLSQADVDSDEVGDECDNCPSNPNLCQGDDDLDEIGDQCDDCVDLDADGISDPGYAVSVACPSDPLTEVIWKSFWIIISSGQGSLIMTSDQGWAVTANDDLDPNYSYCQLYKFDGSGLMLWRQSYPRPAGGYWEALSVCETPDGGIYGGWGGEASGVS